MPLGWEVWRGRDNLGHIRQRGVGTAFEVLGNKAMQPSGEGPGSLGPIDITTRLVYNLLRVTLTLKASFSQLSNRNKSPSSLVIKE